MMVGGQEYTHKAKEVAPFFVLLLLFSTLFTLPSTSAECFPYEVYSVDSVSNVDGWLLMRIFHWSYTCEMIAGEWMPVIGGPDEYYLLTDGNKTIFLGDDAGLVNGTLYVLTVTRARVPYQNVTITIEGKPHNFTLFKNVIVKALYRFNGVCFENASTCRIVSYPNGTKINTCRGPFWNTSIFKLPNVSFTGVPVKIGNGTIRFTLGKEYAFKLSQEANASNLKLRAFTAKRGVVLVDVAPIKVPAGTTLEETPFLFAVTNKTVTPMKFLNLEQFLCSMSEPKNVATSPTNLSYVKSNNKTYIYILLLAILAALSAKLLIKRRK